VDAVWRAGLYHTPSPYTWQSLVFARTTSEYEDELDQRISYRINKTLGPALTASAYSSYHWIDDLLFDSFDRTEWRNGLRVTYQASPKTTFRFTGENILLRYDNGFGDSDNWRGRIECTHRFYERFLTRAVYQHQSHETEVRGRTYHENLAYLSLTWLFD
jgi:hypothetical protein